MQRNYKIFIFTIFAQWFSRGVLGVLCFQHTSTQIFIPLFILAFSIGSPLQGHLSDKINARKQIALIALCCLTLSCLIAYFGLTQAKGTSFLIFLVTALVINGVFGNASPVLTAHMSDGGLNMKESISSMLLYKNIGIMCAILSAFLSLKLCLGAAFLLNCLALGLVHKKIFQEDPIQAVDR